MPLVRRWRTTRGTLLTLTIILGFSLRADVESLRAQEWTRFRGPNGSGVSRATSVPASWSESDYNWRTTLPGTGHGSPVVWGVRIFVVSAPEETGRQIVSCLNTDDGKTLWSREFDSTTHRKHELNSFASATPVVDEHRLYFCWATPQEYIVSALSHAGEPVWRVDLGPFKAGHGSGASPILFDDMLIVANDQDGDSSLVALDCASGDVHWRTPRDTQVTYSTPCVYRGNGRPGELIFTDWKRGITAVDPQTGMVNWETPVFDATHSETAIASPIVYEDLVLGTCGYLGYATHTVAVRPDDSQPAKVQQVYRVDRGAPLSTTPVACDGLLFLWADEGIVTCVDARTGETYWRKRVGGKYYGSPVVIDGRVYCCSSDGSMVVLAAERQYRQLARNPLQEGSHSTPAISGGVMYVRTFTHLISIGG